MWPFRRKQKIETRSAGGFTAEVMQLRESWISGRRGIAELTATAQSCVSLWENSFALADVAPAVIDRCTMGLIGRSLALRGEVVFYIADDRLVPCSDWDIRTRYGRPVAYRLSIPDAGGGQSVTALAAEVLHVKMGADVAIPWIGTAPLRRANLTAGLLHAVESALAETFENSPMGSQVVPMPETPGVDMTTMAREFRGQHGRVLLRESTQVSAAGGPAPQSDWKPADLTPNIEGMMPAAMLQASRDAILGAFGVLPGLFNGATTGPLVREAQRHLAQWTLSPIAALLAEEATEKLGTPVTVDVLRPLHAYDAGGRARALLTVVQALAMAKQGEVDQASIDKALALVDWGDA